MYKKFVQKKKLAKLVLKRLVIIGLVFLLIVALINVRIVLGTKKYIKSDITDLPEVYTALVLGAFVKPSGDPSDILKDRLDSALELYQSQKIKRFLLSGDHGRTAYDEVNNMKDYLIEKGIDTKDIFTDHAGFDTYDSIVRANKIFQVEDAIIVTQEFHLPRAVYIARKKGIEAYGYVADKQPYLGIKKYRLRENLARIKAFMNVLLNKSPKYLGESIPITGDSSLSYD